jgi:hypothetical protein
MDPRVLKYLGLAGITYGTHAYLAIAQIFLFIFLIANGFLNLSSQESLGKWAKRFGFVINPIERNKFRNLLMFATGVSLVLPLFGASYWLAVIACPIAIYLIFNLPKELTDPSEKKTGNFMRKGLILSALLICGFTVWEERELVYVGYLVNYKTIYWKHKEISVWQQENNPNVPKIGEMAPDFELSDFTGEKTVRLSDFRGEKPVVLLFGSFT